MFVVDTDGGHLTQLTRQAPGQSCGSGGFCNGSPAWSPDGRVLVFERDNVRDAVPAEGIALWTVDLRSGRERRIIPFPLRGGDTPDWSPDGRRILFHSNESGPPEISANLYTVRPDGTGLRQLTFAAAGAVNYLGASYSPDGRQITVGRRPETGGTNADIMVMNVDGTGIRNVTRTPLYDSYPDWGPAPTHRRTR